MSVFEMYLCSLTCKPKCNEYHNSFMQKNTKANLPLDNFSSYSSFIKPKENSSQVSSQFLSIGGVLVPFQSPLACLVDGRALSCKELLLSGLYIRYCHASLNRMESLNLFTVFKHYVQTPLLE